MLSRLSVSLLSLAVLANCFLPEALAAPTRKAAPAVKRPGPAQGQAQGQPKTVDLTGPYNAYIGRLRNKIGANWDFPPGKFHVVLQVVVNADGSSGDVTVKSTPQSDAAERAASAALTQAQPLEPLPAQSTPTVRITVNFDSSYDPHGDSSSNISARLDPIQPPRLQPAGPGSPPAADPSAPVADPSAPPAAGQDSSAAPSNAAPADAGGNQ